MAHRATALRLLLFDPVQWFRTIVNTDPNFPCDRSVTKYSPATLFMYGIPCPTSRCPIAQCESRQIGPIGHIHTANRAVAVGEENNINIRVYGEKGGIE